MRAISLFTGIGGLDVASHWAGMETVAFSEIDPYACKVLKKRWPETHQLGNIQMFSNRLLREMGGSPFVGFHVPADYRGTIGVVHGGFPCQDLSVAGRQKGLEGERSGLWYEMLRVIREVDPDWVLAENVRGSINLAFDTVRTGLEDAGYEVEAVLLPASAFGAPHQRERVFIVGVRSDVTDSLRSRGTAWLPKPLQGEEGGPSIPLNDGAPSGSLCPPPIRNCSNGGLNLQTVVRLWATPSIAGNHNRKGCSRKAGDGLATQAGNGGQLNPDWVECLMGYPIGWTDVDCAEPEPWPGWPALMGERLWKTPAGQEPGITPERLTGDLGHRMYDKDTGRLAQYGVSQQVHISQADQYPYEPLRTVTGCKNRGKRLKCLGNAVVPQQAFPFFMAIAIMREALKGGDVSCS